MELIIIIANNNFNRMILVHDNGDDILKLEQEIWYVVWVHTLYWGDLFLIFSGTVSRASRDAVVR